MTQDLTLKQLESLGADLARQGLAGSRRVIGLVGPLGAGKTTLVQAMAKSLGIANAKSPTFTIVNCYNGPKKSLYHVDLYRLEKESELVHIGLDELLADEDSLVAIEWVDKFPTLMKRCDTVIALKITKDNKRSVTINGN
jgi:tRNA threonylcarbamoyladenosine biosynthesis protein TsaE